MRYFKFLAFNVAFLALIPQISNSAEPLQRGFGFNSSFSDTLYWDVQGKWSSKKLMFNTSCYTIESHYGEFGKTLENVLYDIFKPIDFNIMYLDAFELVCKGPTLYLYHIDRFSIDGLDDVDCNVYRGDCANYLLDLAAKQDSVAITNEDEGVVTQIDLSKLIASNQLLTSEAVEAHDKSIISLYKAIAAISAMWLILLTFLFWFYKRHLKSWLKHALYGLMVIIGLLSIPFIWLYRKVTGRRYSPSSVADELYKLKLLRESGEISEEEYLSLKDRLLR